MLTSKQRATLKGLANSMDAIVHIGKSGIGDTLITQIEETLTSRELIKLTVLENAPTGVDEIAQEISKKINAEVVQVIGSKFVIYRANKDLPKEKRIKLK